VDQDSSEVDRAIVELKKASENDMVYKSAGNILVKAKKEELMKELEERKELSGTRSTVLAKQEQRVRESIKELSTKLEGALKSGSNTSAASSN
jgi:prefoldin beta subunit